MNENKPLTDKNGRSICGAKKRSGDACQSVFVMENGRCRIHGGATPKGLASANLKHGRYSRHLPANIYGRVKEHLEDEELLELKSDVALITAMIEEAQRKLYEDKESLSTWRKLLSLKDKVMNARTDDARASYLKQMLGTIDQAERLIAAQDEVVRLLEQRRKSVDSETSRKLKLSQGITLDQVGVFFHALASAVKEEVEPDVLQRIQARFERLSQTSRKLGVDARLDTNEAGD